MIGQLVDMTGAQLSLHRTCAGAKGCRYRPRLSNRKLHSFCVPPYGGHSTQLHLQRNAQVIKREISAAKCNRQLSSG